MDWRLELVSGPVAEVDRAKAFYVNRVGFGVDQDVQVHENHRFVELMPQSMKRTHSYAIMMLKCRTSRTIPGPVSASFPIAMGTVGQSTVLSVAE